MGSTSSTKRKPADPTKHNDKTSSNPSDSICNICGLLMAVQATLRANQRQPQVQTWTANASSTTLRCRVTSRSTQTNIDSYCVGARDNLRSSPSSGCLCRRSRPSRKAPRAAEQTAAGISVALAQSRNSGGACRNPSGDADSMTRVGIASQAHAISFRDAHRQPRLTPTPGGENIAERLRRKR